MLDIKATPIDRLKHRVSVTLSNWLYEASVGHRLKNGELPASIHRMRNYFEKRELASFLPYEVYSDEGLFLNEGSLSAAFFLRTKTRLDENHVSAVAHQIVNEIPVGSWLQLQYFNTGLEAEAYDCVLSLNFNENTPVNDVSGWVNTLEAGFSAIGIQIEPLTPDSLLELLSRFFNEPSSSYDDQDIIKNQKGRVHLNILPGVIELAREETACQKFTAFTIRHTGARRQVPLAHLVPALLGNVRGVLSLGLRHEADGMAVAHFGYLGIGEGTPATWKTLFSRAGWLIEQDKYNTHVSFLAALPMGLDSELGLVLEKTQRARRYTAQSLVGLLPLPYVANRAGSTTAAKTAEVKAYA